MRLKRKYRVGRSCQSWCTKCKRLLEHTIIAMVEELPKRVQCNTCGSQHNFRLPATVAKKKKTTARSRSAKGRRGGNWATLVAEKADAGRDYRMTEVFEAGELVRHPSFGRGLVREALPGDKIEVLFESGTKILAHSRK